MTALDANSANPAEICGRLERREQADKTARLAGGTVLSTPPIEEDYWTYRVRLSDEQAIIGFPKFLTTGIGFAVEEDWNTNLPYTSPAETILAHIDHNKGDDAISDDACLAAIRLIQEAATADAYRAARDAYYAAAAREDAAFARYFAKLQNGERTNGAAVARLSNLTNYASADLASAQLALYALDIDPHDIDRADDVPETPLGA